MPLGSNIISGGSSSEIGRRKVFGKSISGAGARFFARYHVSSSNLVLWLDQGDPQAGTSAATWDDLSGREVSGQDNDMKQATASYQPTVTGAFPGYRDFDGVDNYMHQKEYDDETGATFWPTNAGAIFAATKAAFRVAGVDLSPFASAANDYMLVIHDSADKTAWGVIDVADSAEALGGEVLTDPTLEDLAEWSSVDPNVTHDEVAGTATWDGAGDGLFSTIAGAGQFTVGVLYKIVIEIDSMTLGSLYIRRSAGAFTSDNNPYLIAGTNTAYIVCTNDTRFYLYGTFACNAVVSNISIKEVTHVGTDGVLIMSTKGGSTQSWALQESGIDLNDIDSFEVLKTINQITTALSAFAWVKPDDGQPADQEVVFSKWRSVNDFRSWVVSIMPAGANAGKIEIDFSSDGAANSEMELTDAAFFANGQEIWHHIGFVWDGITCVIWGDGVVLASSTDVGGIPSSLHDTSEKLTIGALSTPGVYFAGLIGPTVVASRAYSADEALRLFQADRPRFM